MLIRGMCGRKRKKAEENEHFRSFALKGKQGLGEAWYKEGAGPSPRVQVSHCSEVAWVGMRSCFSLENCGGGS